MVGEVVADQDVEQVGVAAQVRLREDHQLTLAGVGGELAGAGEVADVAGEHRRGDEDGRRVGRRGPGEELAGGAGVTADEAVEEGLVGGHVTTLDVGADGALTTADDASDVTPERP